MAHRLALFFHAFPSPVSSITRRPRQVGREGALDGKRPHAAKVPSAVASNEPEIGP